MVISSILLMAMEKAIAWKLYEIIALEMVFIIFIFIFYTEGIFRIVCIVC